MKKIPILIMTILLINFFGCKSNSLSQDKFKAENFSYHEVTTAQPLKGFMRFGIYENQNLESSLVYLTIKLKDLLNAENTINFDFFENSLVLANKYKQQVVFRIVLENPQDACYVPDYIQNKITMYEYDFKGKIQKSPDYENEYLQNQIFYLLKGLGEKYNNDPRIAFIQTGIYGHWGEMHTYYVKQQTTSKETITKYIKAVKDAFPDKSVSVRIPGQWTNEIKNLGFYHDMFYSKPDSDYMKELYDLYKTEDYWKTEAITGEFAPNLQDIFDPLNSTDFNKYKDEVNYFHPTTLIAETFYSSKFSFKSAEIRKTSNMLGYDFQVTKANFIEETLFLKIKNNGVAPFYYKWPVKIGLYTDNTLVQEITTDWDITSIQSGIEKEFNYNLSEFLETGKTYNILISIPNPMENGYPINFANKSQDSILEGWLTLGKLSN